MEKVRENNKFENQTKKLIKFKSNMEALLHCDE